MEHKIELPLELHQLIASYLSPREIVNFGQTSPCHLNLFGSRMGEHKKVHQLLKHVVFGKYPLIRKMLEQDINLITKKGLITDRSGRTFESISAFEYALWTLDNQMWTIMLNCIPRDEKNKIGGKLLSQYNNFAKNGITYLLHGKEIKNEKHFDLENILLPQLQILINLINAFEDQDVIEKQWLKLGRLQLLLPMPLVYQYCSKQPFVYPVEILSQKVEPQFHKWFGEHSQLGITIAIYKHGRGHTCSQQPALRDVIHLEDNLSALQEFWEESIKGFINLKSELKQIEIDTQPQKNPSC